MTPQPDTADDERIAAHGAAHDPLVESYRKLADVFHELLSEQSLDDLLHRIADTVGELIPYDDITFYEADEASRELKAVYALGKDAVEVLADPPFPYGVGITGWAVEHREPVLANRAELDPRVRFVTDTQPDPESLIVVPLIARSKLKGTLNIYRSGFQEFTEDEFRLVVRFGDAAALALDNAHIRASLERQAQTDPLTGLWNHRAFHERLRLELVEASAGQAPVSLVMLDLDDFKRVNDVYSHATGDEVLAEVAEILLRSIRSGDSVCRIGGEEFAIIAPVERPRGGPPPRRARAGAGRARRLRPRRLGEPLDRHRRRPRARSEPSRPRRLRGGRDDDREDARPGPGRRLRGRPGRAALRAPSRPPGRDPLDRAPEAAARGLVEAEPAQRRRQDRRDDRGGAAAPDRLPQLSRLRPRRRRPPADRVPRRPRRRRLGDGGAADPGRRGDHRTRRRDRTALPLERRGPVGARGPDRRHRADRGVADRRPAPVRGVGGRRHRRLQARPRPVRPGRAAPARGPRGPCLDRARQRAALRGAAPRGGEREGAARAVLGALVEHGARGGRDADRGRRGADHAVGAGLGLAARARDRRARVLRDVAARPRAPVLAGGRRPAGEPRAAPRHVEHAFPDDARGPAGAPRRRRRAGLRDGRRGRLSRGRRHRGDRGRARLARRAGRPAARAPRRDRRPGAAGGVERALVPGPRAVVPLDDRGARERARGDRRVHLLPRAVDLRRGAPGGRGARPHTRRAEAPRAGCALPRHREDRRPCRRSCGSPARSPSRSGP